MVKLKRSLASLRRAEREADPAESDPVSAEEAAQPTEAAAPPASNRPADYAKVGYVSPTYSVSRSVKLSPRHLMEHKCIAFQSDATETEQYRVLRTQILQRTDSRQGTTIMVTSALPGEGKTLTAINLALTFAKEFRQTALLVDCDLRQQRIHQLLGFPGDKGLVDYLLDHTPLTDLFVWPGIDKLSVVSGGRNIDESSELLGSPGMKSLVEDMKNRYPDRYVFFDVPPVLSGADALAFASLVDYILVAVQAGQTSVQDVNKALRLLPEEKVLGLVLNRQKTQVKNDAKK